MIVRFWAVLLALSMLMVPATAARRALLIGIDDYRALEPLKNAIGDVRALSEVLKSIGYDVVVVTNVGRRDLITAVAKFTESIKEGDTALFHFSGHGVEINQRNFLLAADTPDPASAGEAVLQQEAIAFMDVLAIFDRSKASNRIFILDACRNNPFSTRGARGVGGRRGLAKEYVPFDSGRRGTFILYSAGFGEEALDRVGPADREPTSVYTRNLMRHLQHADRSILDVAIDVRIEVERLAASIGHRQSPAYYDAMFDPRRFALNAGSGSGTARATPAAAAGAPPATSPVTRAITPVLWKHNGSTMRLLTDGDRYEYYYEAPTLRMLANRWRKGDLLFAGQRRGASIEGTIRRSSITCGTISYRASGYVSGDGMRVVMQARAPDRGSGLAGCDVKSHFDETLVFTVK